MLLLSTRAAQAGNDDEFFVGNAAAISAGAVVGTVDDASSTWYNPAGLGRDGRGHIDVSGTAYTLRFYFAPQLLRATTGESEDASISEFIAIPSQIAYSRGLGRGVTLGLGYFSPQGSNLKLRESLRVYDAGAESALQVALGITRSLQILAAGLGFPLSRRVRLGFSLIGTYETEAESTSIFALRGEDGRQTEFASSSALSTFSRIGLEAGIGFQFDLGESFILGVSARSPRALVTQEIDASVSVGVAREDAGVAAQILEPSEAVSGIHALRAGRAVIGLSFRPAPGSFIAGEVSVEPGIYNLAAGIERKTVVNGRIGGLYRLSEVFSIGGGIFSDRSPDPDRPDPIAANGDFYGASLGVEIRDRHLLAAKEASDSMVLSTVLAFRYAFSSGDINAIVMDPTPGSSGTLSAAPGHLTVHETSLYFGGGVTF
ncbi:MAG TPA: hypothetical protein VGK73_02395 [Polyangiaceae bacterium]